ncbi:MAG TPA: alpha/beta hydrolase [Arachnia sp.]|nr:alpha/beta hydrolase [Arachnia sp.]HMT86281.1 alpha/beta hydrolase [Arachnia sp.]
MSTSDHSILFLSGAGLPAWIWDDVRGRLAARYDTRAAPRPGTSNAALGEYVTAAMDVVTTDRVTIVGHSAGGVVGAEIARRMPERVSGFLAVSAVIPPPHGSFLTAMPIPNRWILGAAMRLAGTRPPEAAIRKSLAAGIDERIVDRLIVDFTPESQGYYRDRIGTQPWGGRRGYVSTTRDRELPVALQRRFAARLAAPWQHELATGHLPMLEDPDSFAEVVASFVA